MILGILCGLGASVTWAFANFAIAQASRELGETAALWWAQGAAGVVLAALWLLFGEPAVPPLGTLAFTGAAAALAYFGMARAYRLGTLSIMVPILTLWSAIAALTGYFFLGESLSAFQWVGVALVCLGSAGNGAASGQWERPTLPAVLWALGGALGFGWMVVGLSMLRPILGILGALPMIWAAQWVLLWPLTVGARLWATPVPRGRAWGPVLAMSSLEAVGFLLYTHGLSLAPVGVVSPAASLAMVMTVLWLAVTGREKVSALRWVFIAIAGGGTVLLGG